MQICAVIGQVPPPSFVLRKGNKTILGFLQNVGLEKPTTRTDAVSLRINEWAVIVTGYELKAPLTTGNNRSNTYVML